MPSKVIQQLLNILQASNVAAGGVPEGGNACESLLRAVLFANGATCDGMPLAPPATYVGDYLIYYVTPDGETAYLTRAQAEVIDTFWDLHNANREAHDTKVSSTVYPIGCCTDEYGKTTQNVPSNKCNGTWSQGPCPTYLPK
jgi:hypothetical protein